MSGNFREWSLRRCGQLGIKVTWQMEVTNHRNSSPSISHGAWLAIHQGQHCFHGVPVLGGFLEEPEPTVRYDAIAVPAHLTMTLYASSHVAMKEPAVASSCRRCEVGCEATWIVDSIPEESPLRLQNWRFRTSLEHRSDVTESSTDVTVGVH